MHHQGVFYRKAIPPRIRLLLIPKIQYQHPHNASSYIALQFPIRVLCPPGDPQKQYFCTFNPLFPIKRISYTSLEDITVGHHLPVCFHKHLC